MTEKRFTYYIAYDEQESLLGASVDENILYGLFGDDIIVRKVEE